MFRRCFTLLKRARTWAPEASRISSTPTTPTNPLLACIGRWTVTPSGHGRELAEFLAPITVVNGYGSGDAAGTTPTALAAQAVAHFKNDQGIGGIYLEPTTRTAVWEDYVYKVFASEEAQIRVEVYRVHGTDHELLFSSSPTEMLAWIKNQEQEN